MQLASSERMRLDQLSVSLTCTCIAQAYYRADSDNLRVNLAKPAFFTFPRQLTPRPFRSCFVRDFSAHVIW